MNSSDYLFKLCSELAKSGVESVDPLFLVKVAKSVAKETNEAIKTPDDADKIFTKQKGE